MWGRRKGPKTSGYNGMKIVFRKKWGGSPGMVMESRKAATALRARLLRFYVPLRRVPSESVLSGAIPGLPGESYPPHKFKFQNVQFAVRIGCRNHKGRYLCGRVE